MCSGLKGGIAWSHRHNGYCCKRTVNVYSQTVDFYDSKDMNNTEMLDYIHVFRQLTYGVL